MLGDIRYAVRTLTRAPGFALSAVLALALGIGANTAVFSVVYAVLLKPLPYPSPDRLVQLSEANPVERSDEARVSRGTFVDWLLRVRTLSALAAYSSSGEALWTIEGRLQIVNVAAGSPSLPAVLSVQPLLGRWVGTNDPAASTGVVISYGLWQRAFGGRPDVLRRPVTIEGRTAREIVGVMPRRFAFPDDADAWVLLDPGPSVPAAQRRYVYYHAIGRVADGRTIDDVARECSGISAQLSVEQPDANAGWNARVVPLAGADTGAVRPALAALVAAVAGVLLIGCANVANLLLARATARRREVAVRVALGAGAGRIARQCLADALVLAAGGVSIGFLLGAWLSGVLVRLAPPGTPRLGDVAVGLPIFLFAATIGLVATILTSLVPAYQAMRADVQGSLRADTRGATSTGSGIRRALIAGQVAVVMLLLTGALLLVRTFVNLRGVDLGFETSHTINVETRWPVGRLAGAPRPGPRTPPWPAVQRAVDGLIEAVASVPGVEAVGLTADVPLTGAAFDGTVWRADAPGAHGLTPPADLRDRWSAELTVVTQGYFQAMNVPLLRGRAFRADDRFTDAQLNDVSLRRTGVTLVNRAFASRYFPDADPIGRTIVIYDDQAFGVERTIVGVVGDFHRRGVAEMPEPAVFIPHAQHPDVFRPSLVVRSALPAAAIGAALRERLHAYDPQLLVLDVRPMGSIVSGALSRPRFNLLLVGSFALVALSLSALGVYGVLAYLVAQRTREIGIRMALGARAADVVRLVLAEGMTPVAAGAAAGLLAAGLAARAMRSLLFGVAPLDPISFGAAPLLLAAVALLACYVPARRAAAVDPLVALRDE